MKSDIYTEREREITHILTLYFISLIPHHGMSLFSANVRNYVANIDLICIRIA